MPRRSQTRINRKIVTSAKPRSKVYEIRDRDLRGFILRVAPTGTKTYYAQWARGKRSRIGDANIMTPARARDVATQVLAAGKRGEQPMPRLRGQVPTFESYLSDHYGPYISRTQKSGKANLKRLRAAFSNLQRLKLDELSTSKLDKWKVQRIDAGRKASTINRDLATLKAALRQAVAWGIIDQSPLAGVRLLRAEDNQRVRYLSQDEEGRLFDALDRREAVIRKRRRSGNSWRADRRYDLKPDLSDTDFADHLKPMVILSMHTGLRWGELSGLQWKNVVLEKTPGLTVAAGQAKTGRTRWVPLNSSATETLVQWYRQSENASLFVFPGRAGGKLDNVKRAWFSVLDDAGIVDFRWHDLRHHFASQLVMRGEDLNTVRELLGHQSIQMTLRYAHLAEDHKSRAVERLVK